MEDQAPGARRGSRRATRPARPWDRRTSALAAGTVAAVAAWGGLVYAGTRFAQSVRGGDGTAWAFLIVAAVGAVACLFLALMLGIQVARALGIGRPHAAGAVKGGRRAAGKRSAPRSSRWTR